MLRKAPQQRNVFGKVFSTRLFDNLFTLAFETFGNL